MLSICDKEHLSRVGNVHWQSGRKNWQVHTSVMDGGAKQRQSIAHVEFDSGWLKKKSDPCFFCRQQYGSDFPLQTILEGFFDIPVYSLDSPYWVLM